MKQYAHNACGTIAMFHTILNLNTHADLINSDSVLAKFREKTINMSPDERGKLFQTDSNIRTAHQSVSSQGQSEIKV